MRRSRPSRLSLAADQAILPFLEVETMAGPEFAPPTTIPAVVMPSTIGPVEGTVDDPVAALDRRILEGSSSGASAPSG